MNWSISIQMVKRFFKYFFIIFPATIILKYIFTFYYYNFDYFMFHSDVIIKMLYCTIPEIVVYSSKITIIMASFMTAYISLKVNLISQLKRKSILVSVITILVFAIILSYSSFLFSEKVVYISNDRRDLIAYIELMGGEEREPDLLLRAKTIDEMNRKEIKEEIKDFGDFGLDTAFLLYEYQRKLLNSYDYINLVILGLALGFFSTVLKPYYILKNEGNVDKDTIFIKRAGIVVCILIVYVYNHYIWFIETMVDKHIISTNSGPWLPNLSMLFVSFIIVLYASLLRNKILKKEAERIIQVINGIRKNKELI